MGMVFENLTLEELCDLMCGMPEDELEEEEDDANDSIHKTESTSDI